MVVGMDGDELMMIGRFAHLSGLSIHALRHYDDVGLLSPAVVDPASGYRRYRHSQLRNARLIQALRWIDMPIEEIRQVIEDETGDGTRDVLTRHRRRLERQHSVLTARIDDVGRFTERGITMPAFPSGCRPVQIKIAVQDTQASIAFYQQAFGLCYDVTRRTTDEDFSGFLFGEYGRDSFFLLHLIDDQAHTDLPGPSTFGLSVEDLDAFHTRAVAAGATEVVAPQDPEGMPRCSAVRDPSGNWIWLYQG